MCRGDDNEVLVRKLPVNDGGNFIRELAQIVHEAQQKFVSTPITVPAPVKIAQYGQRAAHKPRTALQ